MIPGMDAAAAVSPAVARQLGAQFVARYLAPYPAQAWKLITPDELRALRDAGIPVVFNWESNGTPGDGWDTGVDAAQQAQALLNDRATALGDPSVAQAPVIFTFADVDVAQANIPTLIAAHRGAASVLGLGRCGGYGGISAIAALFDAGAITYGWQTYAWSGGRWDPRAQLRQCANSLSDGVSHDYDEAWADDYGQWPRPTQAAPAATPTATPGVDVTPDELRQAIRDVLGEQAPSRVPGSTVQLGIADCARNSDAADYITAHTVTDPITSGVPGSKVQMSPRDVWRNAEANSWQTARQLEQLVATVSTLVEVVKALNPPPAGSTTVPTPTAGA